MVSLHLLPLLYLGPHDWYHKSYPILFCPLVHQLFINQAEVSFTYAWPCHCRDCSQLSGHRHQHLNTRGTDHPPTAGYLLSLPSTGIPGACHHVWLCFSALFFVDSGHQNWVFSIQTPLLSPTQILHGLALNVQPRQASSSQQPYCFRLPSVGMSGVNNRHG